MSFLIIYFSICKDTKLKGIFKQKQKFSIFIENKMQYCSYSMEISFLIEYNSYLTCSLQ